MRFADIRRFASIDSTNRYLLECAADGQPEGVVAVADEQTAGRGRLGRSWIAPPRAALLVSVLLRPALPPDRMHLVTLGAALALVDVVPEHARIKWPNDVVVDDRKLAGILAEADGQGAVVVGMGCNVRGDWFPPELQEIATATGMPRDELLDSWLSAFDTRLDLIDQIIDDARKLSATIGRHVRVELPGRTFEGTATALTPEGYLVVDDHVVTAADVVHLR
jgi:BirA family biotin operon repressor/biotin-[acetyl-CoA-carboxylase] ligase